MPTLITQKKAPVFGNPKKSLKTLTIDDYFFRSLEQDLKKTSPGKEEIVKKQPVDIKTKITEPPRLKPKTVPAPTKIPLPPKPVPPKKAIAPPKKLKKAKAKALAKIEAAKKEKLSQIAKKQIKELFKQGKFHYRNKNFSQAINIFQECLKLKPDFKKAKKYFLKSQKKLVASQKKKQEDLGEIQKEAVKEAERKAKTISQARLQQELKVARIQAGAQAQAQVQQLENKIRRLKQKRQTILQQEIQEKEELQRAEERKIKTQAILKAQQQAQKQLEQTKQQQIGDIRKEISQQTQPQLQRLKQQLAEQEKSLEMARAQKQATEKQRQQIQQSTQEHERRLEELKEQVIIPSVPDNLPVEEKKAAELPSIEKPLPVAPPVIAKPQPRPQPMPQPMPRPKPRPLPPAAPPSPLAKPPVIGPVIKPKPRPVPVAAKLRPQIKLPRKAFPVKKAALALGGILAIALIGFGLYWRFALKPTPPPPSPLKQQPRLIIRFNRPPQDTFGWQKILKTIIPQALNLSLENYQIDAFKSFNPWLAHEIFYLSFDDQINKEEVNGVFILGVDDKAQAQELFERIKARPSSQASLENYHQYDIIKCQDQYWALADVFNLHYLVLSQKEANLKLVLDYFNEQDLGFIESLEDKTSFWQGLSATKINVWLDPANQPSLIKQALSAIDLKTPWQVSENLKNYFAVLLLDVLESEEPESLAQQTKTAAIFAFDDFDKTNQAMLAWEKTMSHDTAFLFWDLKPSPPTTLNFQGVIYNGAIIRFLMMPDADLGIYYGLTKSNLILTSSENNVKLLLDYFK